jgi:TfoX N-terminal domain
MAYDETLARRVRSLLPTDPTGVEKKMFGGLAFMTRGAMFVGVMGSTLMARVGPGQYAHALEQPGARVMAFTGKPMKGYVYVDAPGIATDADLAVWLDRCLGFVRTLPAK